MITLAAWWKAQYGHDHATEEIVEADYKTARGAGKWRAFMDRSVHRSSNGQLWTDQWICCASQSLGAKADPKPHGFTLNTKIRKGNEELSCLTERSCGKMFLSFGSAVRRRCHWSLTVLSGRRRTRPLSISRSSATAQVRPAKILGRQVLLQKHALQTFLSPKHGSSGISH